MMQLAIVGSDKPFIWLVEPHYRIGKDNTCDIKLADETLQGVHLQLNVDGDSLMLVPAGRVSVNDTPVTVSCPVKHGDRLQLGKSELRVVDPKVAAQVSRPSSKSSAGSHAHEPWILHGLSTALSEKRYSISAAQTVGRGQNCDIFLAVAHLSRQHARLSLDDKGLLVEDLGSANGTFVNGKRIDKIRLKSGDELRFDTLRFRVQAPGADIDLDKTMMRPATEGPALKKPTRIPPSQAGAAASRQPPKGGARAPISRSVDRPVSGPTSASGQRWWMLGALLAILALGALWVVKSQLIVV